MLYLFMPSYRYLWGQVKCYHVGFFLLLSFFGFVSFPTTTKNSKTVRCTSLLLRFETRYGSLQVCKLWNVKDVDTSSKKWMLRNQRVVYVFSKKHCFYICCSITVKNYHQSFLRPFESGSIYFVTDNQNKNN